MVTRQSRGGTAFGVADDLPDRENRADAKPPSAYDAGSAPFASCCLGALMKGDIAPDIGSAIATGEGWRASTLARRRAAGSSGYTRWEASTWLTRWWAARCAYDFVMPRAQCDVATTRWIRGGDHEIVRVIFFRAGGFCLFQLTSWSERVRVWKRPRENVGAWRREIATLEAIAAPFRWNAFCS